MAEEGRQHGLEVPSMRPDELATDEANPNEMWRHARTESEKQFGCEFGVSLLLQPATSLRRPEEVERSVTAPIGAGHPAAATVCAVPAGSFPQQIAGGWRRTLLLLSSRRQRGDAAPACAAALRP